MTQILCNIRFSIQNHDPLFTQDINFLRNSDIPENEEFQGEFPINIGTRFTIDGLGQVEVTDIQTRFLSKEIDHSGIGINMSGIGEENPWNFMIIYSCRVLTN